MTVVIGSAISFVLDNWDEFITQLNESEPIIEKEETQALRRNYEELFAQTAQVMETQAAMEKAVSKLTVILR